MNKVNIDPLVEEARIKRTPPRPSREKGQRTFTHVQPFLTRYIPPYAQPDWLGAERWRRFVQAQPIAVDCREAIINSTVALDWKIVPRDNNKLDELKPVIEYYTNFLRYTGKYSWSDIVEWLLKDYLDIPFGGCAEVGREGDRPEGRVVWIELLDGGLCFPTHNKDYPVGVQNPTDTGRPVFLPAHAVDRIFMSPRTEFKYSGWGMAPPEKIYLAIELVGRGDKYYSNLLLDTPEAGILDLLDMSKTGAEEWLEAFKSYMEGIDPYKIGVLYEHTTAAKWIPFGRPPTELMFDKVILKYSSIICSGYGLTLADVGFAGSTSGGDTLAGAIRQERTSRMQGKAKARRRLKQWVDQLIDPSQKQIEFQWADIDDEIALNVGRARLANATAMNQFVESGMISPQEGRLQMMQDGVFTIAMPEKLPPEAQEKIDLKLNPPKPAERPGMVGSPISPSQGGHGDKTAKSEFETRLQELINVDNLKLKRLANAVLKPLSTSVNRARDELELSEMGLWAEWQSRIIWGEITDDIPELTNTVLEASTDSLQKVMVDEWWSVFSNPDDIVDELLEMYRAVQAENAYVVGKSDSVDDYKLPKVQYNKLRKAITQEIKNINDLMKSKVQKAVLAGATVYLANELDETLKIDDNLINNIRNQLMFLSDKILIDFGKNLLDLMEKQDE